MRQATEAGVSVPADTDGCARARVPCTCGELFQGSLDGEPCLVSCPINVYSVAHVSDEEAVSGPKVQRALLGLGLPRTLAVSVRTPLPVGRGYGTSTADIGAALYAASRAAGTELDRWEAVRIAVGVEPTDSTLLPGLALLDHRRGRFFRVLGPPPPLRIMMLDPGGYVDTESFNRQDWRDTLRTLARGHRHAYELLRLGITHGDPACIGEAATMSALLHEAILPNPLVTAAREMAPRVGAVGVCRAHSGTIVGLLFDPRHFDEERSLREVSVSASEGVACRLVTLVEGGVSFT